MKQRKTATVRSAREQLSFFDPGGDLPDLREEARRISTATEHQAFLGQGLRRAQAALPSLRPKSKSFGAMRHTSPAVLVTISRSR